MESDWRWNAVYYGWSFGDFELCARYVGSPEAYLAVQKADQFGRPAFIGIRVGIQPWEIGFFFYQYFPATGFPWGEPVFPDH